MKKKKKVLNFSHVTILSATTRKSYKSQQPRRLFFNQENPFVFYFLLLCLL